jgi:hypothetical protein
LKAIQAVAGFRTTYILTEQLKTSAFGTSSSFPYQKGVYNFIIEMPKVHSHPFRKPAAISH